ncbi:MAG: alanine dehydrogenase, partial [Gammaproteobacteria bacterium]
MRIGIPREIKPFEGRVALIPEAASELVRAGHEVFVERDAGRLSGYADEDYRAIGATLLPDAETLYKNAELIIKVKEPTPEEVPLLRKEHILFCFLHLAANVALACQLKAIGLTAIAFETVEENGTLPLLAPMSDIAGRIAVQVGTHLLHLPMGGRGILL